MFLHVCKFRCVWAGWCHTFSLPFTTVVGATGPTLMYHERWPITFCGFLRLSRLANTPMWWPTSLKKSSFNTVGHVSFSSERLKVRASDRPTQTWPLTSQPFTPDNQLAASYHLSAARSSYSPRRLAADYNRRNVTDININTIMSVSNVREVKCHIQTKVEEF